MSNGLNMREGSIHISGTAETVEEAIAIQWKGGKSIYNTRASVPTSQGEGGK